MITGLVIGGVLASPLGALAAAKLSAKPPMIMVGCLVSILSLVDLFSAMHKLF